MKRKPELSWLNVVFCAMVLWSHCSAHPITVLDRGSWQFLLVYLLQRLSFVSVYGFFLLSGLKLTLPRRREPPVPEYWKGRMKNIFLPYLLAVLIYYLWFVFCLHYFPFSLKDLAGYVVRGDLVSPFYFVIALFQFVLLAPALKKFSRRWSPYLTLPFSLGITWLSAQYLGSILEVVRPGLNFAYGDRIFTTYLFYFLAGCCIGQNYDGFVAMLRENRGLVTGLFVLFTAADLIFSALMITGTRSTPFLEEVHFLYLMSAILFLFLAAVELNRPLPPWLAAAEKASFLVYLYHSLVISGYNAVMERLFPGTRVGILFLGRLLAVYVGCTIACVLWQELRGRVVRYKTK